VQKLLLNVDDTDYKCQFHQHFTSSFFVQKYFYTKVFFHPLYANNLGLLFFGLKGARKMLVK